MSGGGPSAASVDCVSERCDDPVCELCDCEGAGAGACRAAYERVLR